MIKNQKQAANTREKLSTLKADKEKFIAQKGKLHKFKFKIGINSFDTLIKQLEAEIAEYESLVSGNFHCLQPKSLNEISHVLIAARLAQKMSQKDLAVKLGLDEQQIQRYEATDYETASIVKIIQISKALNIAFHFEKIVINTPARDKGTFLYPKGITAKKIKLEEEKYKKGRSFILQAA